MFNIAYNGIITVTRGDSFRLPIALNYGTNLEPLRYQMSQKNFVYFAVIVIKIEYVIFWFCVCYCVIHVAVTINSPQITSVCTVVCL